MMASLTSTALISTTGTRWVGVASRGDRGAEIDGKPLAPRRERHPYRIVGVVSVLVLGLVLVLSLASCSRYDAAGGNSFAATATAPALPMMAAATENLRMPPRNDSLAYEHEVTVALSKELLSPRIQALQNSCTSAKEFTCTLLDVTAGSWEKVPSGTVRLRLSPPGVEPMIALAGQGGEVTTRRTHSEDLAEPVADTERELAQLTTHRDRLQELMKAKDIKIDSLITVSRELAQVQSQLDGLATQKANLRRRIDTELLTITLKLPDYAVAGARTPVVDAFRSFGADFKEAIANVIRFFAMALPWLVVIVPALVLLRLFWRWTSRWIARREARGTAP